MNELTLDHVAVATDDLAAAITLYEGLTGSRSSAVEELPAQGVRVAFVGMVELLQPLSPDSAVGRFLERNGPGMHHIAYRTEDIHAELARVAALGYELVDPEPRRGAFGHLVAFLHPRSTGKVLVELVQHR